MRPLARVDYGWPDEYIWPGPDPDDDEEDDEENPTGLGFLANIHETDRE